MRQPDPSSQKNTAAYLDDQAALGRFMGKTSALSVLRYLAQHAWRQYPNEENAPIGSVMSGKSRIKKISSETAMSERSVQYAMGWLEQNGWIEREEVYENNRRSYDKISTLLDPRSHRIREEMIELRGAVSAPTGVQILHLQGVQILRNDTRDRHGTSTGAADG